MPGAKSFFSNINSNKSLKVDSRLYSETGVESFNLVKARLEQKNRFEPQVDYNIPSQFARYGSAVQYYEDSVNYVLESYPYDGSLYEKLDWEVSASFLDKFIFEKKYPRTNGYINLGLNYGSFNTENSGYGVFGDNRHITFRSGPHTASSGMLGKPIAETFKLSNKYDADNKRAGNLDMDFDQGVSLEFWLEKNGFISGSESVKQVIFDLWNNGHIGSSSYGRFKVEIHPGITNEENSFYVEVANGAGGGTGPGSTVDLGSSLYITGSGWNHWAITLQNSGSSLYGQIFKNGELNQTKLLGSSISTPITGAVFGSIGALKANPLPTGSAGPSIGEGAAKLSGSLDELRFWKVKRTNADIGRNWFTQVGGGTNTDISNVDLGIYYKFNEGIFDSTASNPVDSTILDYSGRISNGYWINYVTGSRVTSSAMVLSRAAEFEFADPIIHAQHPDILYLKNQLEQTGTNWDDINNAGIYNSFPQWIIDDDQFKSRKVLLHLVQSVASYFDNLHMQLDALPHLKNTTYASASFKPAPFVNRFLEGAGMFAPDIFEEANMLESISNRDDFREYSEKFYDVRNRIYQNIYNNLSYIYKSKGTEKSFRNLIRCFGIGEELVKINLYSNNITFELRDNFKSQISRKKYADFNNVDRFDSTVYQHTSSYATQSYIASNPEMAYKANTYECEAIFPKKFGQDSQLYFETPFLTSSIYGAHGAITGSDNKTWASSDYASFQVQAIRKSVESKDVYFQLTSSNGGIIPTLTSSLFKDVYDNEKWNFAVRIKPNRFALSPNVTGSSNDNYIVEFLGYNNDLDLTKNSFHVTGVISNSNGASFLTQAKRFFIGAHRTNFTGSTLQLSDAKISSLRVWISYLENEAIEAHARDASNYGTLNPLYNSYLSDVSSSFGEAIEIPQASTLALHWTFENVTSSGDSSDSLPTTSDAKFTVLDVSSGSYAGPSRYSWMEPIIGTIHNGQGDFYLPFDENAIQREYVYTAKQQIPEVVNSDDLVEILETNDDLIFKKDSRPANHFFAVEKSMWSVVSEEMLKLFATIKDFNNLIGDPVNRYRLNYKAIEHLRSLFFQRVGNTPDLDQYVEYFKWIDNSISHILQQLIPASANFSEDMRTVIESHVLERNKYWNKFPTLEIKSDPPEAGLKGVHHLTYSWEEGHAPVSVFGNIASASSNATEENQLWWKNRAERNLPFNTSNNTNIDSNRTSILSVRLSALNREFTTPVRLLAAKSSDTSSSAKPGHAWDTNQIVSLRNIKNDKATSFISASVKNPDGTYAHIPIGNFKHDYELIQTSGRRINDRYRTKYQYSELELIVSDDLESTAVYKLPVRGSGTLNKSIFVERFSAPGGAEVMSRGSLDVLSEEISIYNEMNQRNSSVRIPLNKYEKTHTDQFGLNPNSSSMGNWHKVHRNTRKQVVEDGSGSFLTSSKYDNAFVSHIIPQNDSQYLWITRSIDERVDQPIGFQSDFTIPTSGGLSRVGSNFTFITSSRVVSYFDSLENDRLFGYGEGTPEIVAGNAYNLIHTNFNGLNFNIAEGLTASSNFLGFEQFNITPLTDGRVAINYVNPTIIKYTIEPNISGGDNPGIAGVLNSILLNRNGPYHYPSWKQIRNVDHPVVRNHRKNNIVSVLDHPEQREIITQTGQRLIYSDNRPDRFVNFIEPPVVFRNKPMVHVFDINGSKAPVTLRHSYANNIAGFSNTDLNNRLGLYKCVPQTYDSLLNLYLETDSAPEDNPINGFLKLSYSEVIFPKEENTGKREIRTRIEYGESSSYEPYDTLKIWVPYPDTTADTTYGELSSGTIDSRGHNGIDRSPLERRTFWHSNPRIRSRYALPSNLPDYSDRNFFRYSGSYATPLISSQGIKDGKAPSIWSFPCELHHTSAFNINLNDTISYWNNYDFGELSSLRSLIVQLNPFYATGAAVVVSDFQYFQNIFDRRYGSGSEFSTPAPPGGLYLYKYPTSSISYTNYPTSYAPPSLWWFNMENKFSHPDDRIQFGDFEHIYRTHIHAGKNPWYDSYEDFFEDIRPNSKDMSTIPEFNISDHLDFYVVENGGNFRKRNDKFLKNVGIETELTFSAESESGGFKENFFKKYAHSDYMKHFDSIVSDHERGDLEVSRITLKCSGIKKLRPYNGFYPITRTPQLAQLFSQSYAPFFGGTAWKRGQSTAPTAPASGALAMQAVNQIFFAPGILFNTIKAGIAMDWPVLTGSIYTFASGAYVPVGSTVANTTGLPPNFRVPFEALISLKEGGIPLSSSTGEKKINWLGPQYFENIFTSTLPPDYIKEIFFDWTGEQTSPLYSLAMHNFLAETINFFLEDGNLETIVSKPVNQFKSMVSGNSYYMDVRLYRSDDFKMYGTYFDVINRFRHTASALDTELVPTYGNIATNPSRGGSDLIPVDVGLGWTGMYYGIPYNWMDDNVRLEFYVGFDSDWGGHNYTSVAQMLYSDPAYAPNLPPYYWGDCVARLKYTADGTEGQSIDILTKILSEIEVENINRGLFATMMFHNTNAASVFDLAAWQGRSTVSSSVDLFGIIKGQKIVYDAKSKNKRSSISEDGGTQQFAASTGEDADSSFNRWVISPRMEVPILNFINQPEEFYKIIVGNNNPNNSYTYAQWRIPHGMWSGYGEFCTGETGLFLSLEESFPDLPNTSADPDGEGSSVLTGSLIDVMGFKKEQRKLGEIANNKLFEEAILAIPFVDDPPTEDSLAPTVKIMGRNFFSISRENYDKQKDRIESGKPAVEPNQEFGNIQIESTSISKLSQLMRKYVIPPELNFDAYKDINPFVIYFLEFGHMLDKQDLADIWQGVMPNISMTPEKDEVSFSHEMAPWEFFEGKKLPSKIRWLIFKVKKRAAVNYFEKTANSKDDNRFKFDFDVGKDIIPEYSYNWPYDYCSLVEVAKIEATIDIEPRKAEDVEPVKAITENNFLQGPVTRLPQGFVPVRPSVSPAASVITNKTKLRNPVAPIPRFNFFGRKL